TIGDRAGEGVRRFEIGAMLGIRLEGLTLRVANVKRSIEFYQGKLGFSVDIDKAPQFAMIRVGGPTGGTIGLLADDVTDPSRSSKTLQQREENHIVMSIDDHDTLYVDL